jgi:hypothetical protein
MFPDKDWSFLDNRKREMSDRAKQNEKMKAIYEKLDKEEEITDEDLIAAGLMEPKTAEDADDEEEGPHIEKPAGEDDAMVAEPTADDKQTEIPPTDQPPAPEHTRSRIASTKVKSD